MIAIVEYPTITAVAIHPTAATATLNARVPEPERMAMDPGERIERGRHLLLVGLVAVVAGTVLGFPIVAWSGLAVVLVGFASNTVGKTAHFRGLPLAAAKRWSLLGTWVALALLAAAVVSTLVASSFAGVEWGGYWPLAVATVVVALLHRQLQVRFLSGIDGVEPGEY